MSEKHRQLLMPGFYDPPSPFSTLESWKVWLKTVQSWKDGTKDKEAYLKEARDMIKQKRKVASLGA
jgi:hypothetical protein